ncbi:hypothetical protein [Pseudomonas sp. S1(2024)]|uniref:hypothetical protein n=1 Tax=Pseudomonas sp. S1(2024) TaxID=3390191 RepID=UPI00397A80C9
MKLKRLFGKGALSVVGAGALMALFAVDASAATGLDGMGSQWKTQFAAGIGIAKMAFAMIGFFLFAGGLFYFYKDSKQPGQGEVKKGIVACLVGTGLMIIPWLLGVFTETVATGEGDNAENATKGTTF